MRDAFIMDNWSQGSDWLRKKHSPSFLFYGTCYKGQDTWNIIIQLELYRDNNRLMDFNMP